MLILKLHKTISSANIFIRNRGYNMNKKNIIMNLIIIITMILSFFIIDFGIRYFIYENYKFYSYYNLAPNLFTLSTITLFIGIFYILPKKKRRIFYLITLLISNFIGFSQYLHFKNLDRFYGINDIFLLREGSKYFGHALNKIDIKILSIILISLMLSIIVIKLSKKYNETYRDKLYFIFLIGFTILCSLSLFICAKFRLGKEINEAYDASLSPLEVYNSFNDPNKNMQVVGMYTSLSRGFNLYINKKFNNNHKELIKEINEYLDKNHKELETNEYTGVFKDKNIIVILMESIDTFLINEEVMPTLYKLSKEGIDFTNRYSPTFGSGETINSEFALNTSLYTSLEGNIYNYENTYKYSLANMFKNSGYSAISIHYNSGYFYNRSNFHPNLGYEKHYALLDTNDNDGFNYEYDSNLIKSPITKDIIIRDNKFLSFITTYSTHLPYDDTNNKCLNNPNNFKVKDKELECIYNLAYDTDLMLKLLIEELSNKNKLNDTALVLVSDHYLYGYTNVTNYKKTSNTYLLQHTPFIIWNNNIEHKNINKLVDTTDILPTILNMFGIEYNPNLYVGEDTFSSYHNNYIYFNEDIYYKDNTLYDKTYNYGDKEIYNQIKETIKFNNNLIETNYLKND